MSELDEQEQAALRAAFEPNSMIGDSPTARIAFQAGRAYRPAPGGVDEARSHDPLLGFYLSWRDGAYHVSVPCLLKEGERLHVVEASRLFDAEAEVAQLRERIEEHVEEPEAQTGRLPKHQEITEEQIAAATSALERLDPQWRATAYGPRRYAIEALQAAFYGEDGE